MEVEVFGALSFDGLVQLDVIIDRNERIFALSSQASGFSYEDGIKYPGIWDEMLIELCIIGAKSVVSCRW